MRLTSATTAAPGLDDSHAASLRLRAKCLPAPCGQRLRAVDDSLRLFTRQMEAGLVQEAEDSLQQAIWELQALDRELSAHLDRD